jgi:hypothetical protein
VRRTPVALESPFNGLPADREQHARYLAWCVRDSYRRGEAPYCGHAIGPLGHCEDDPAQREAGLEADDVFNALCVRTVLYVDIGFSSGMRHGYEAAKAAGRPTEERYLPNDDFVRFMAGEYPPGATMRLIVMGLP